MGLFDTVAGKPAASGSTIHLEGKEQVSVVEAAYPQEAVERVAGRDPEESLGVSFPATLVPETTNPDDPNAIAVQGEGRTVGHLISRGRRRVPSCARSEQVVGPASPALGLREVNERNVWSLFGDTRMRPDWWLPSSASWG